MRTQATLCGPAYSGVMSTALVTGATAGIGLSFAHLLAERGHDVVLVARDRAAAGERLRRAAGEVRRRHRDPRGRPVRPRRDRQGRRAARRPGAPVDLLVNNAGYSLKGSFLRHDVTEEEANFDVLCRAVLVLSHAAGNAMRERGHGAIVNVSSVASFITSGTYSANKSYVTVFTEGLAAELQGQRGHGDRALPRLHPHRVPPAGRRRHVEHPRLPVARRRPAGARLPRRRRQGPRRLRAVAPVQGDRRGVARRAPLARPASRRQRPPPRRP